LQDLILKRKPRSQTFKGELSWKFFSSAAEGAIQICEQILIPSVDESTAKEMRTLYNKFLKVVMKLVGEETSSEELHSAAFFVFDTLSDPGMQDAKKKYFGDSHLSNHDREALNSTFGIVSAELYREFASMVSVLSEVYLEQNLLTFQVEK
jgi:hypothetical protein